MKEETEFTHPSYVMVQFSHRQGSPKLFHSALEHHYNYVTLSVRHAKLMRSDTGDRLYGSVAGDILEIDLSASQFSELLTTMNIGMGVAGTLRRFDGERIPPPPDLNTQPENLRVEFKARAKDFSKKVLAESDKIHEMLKNKATINKGDREEISSLLRQVAQELEQNMPFLVEMYQEATEKVAEAAKAEVEAFMVGAVRQAGLQALVSGQASIELPQLKEKSE